MKKFFIIVCIAMLSGCAAAGNMDELLTLKALADEQDSMHLSVQLQDKKFEELLELFKTDEHKSYKKERNFRKHFGPPIYKKDVLRNGEPLTLWVYRYSTQYFDSEKVHLYFDSKGKLTEWEVLD